MSNYFQINRNAHPTTKTLKKAWERIDDADRWAIKRLEQEAPSGIAHISMIEILCKVALYKKSLESDHPHKGILARMDVVKDALKGV